MEVGQRDGARGWGRNNNNNNNNKKKKKKKNKNNNNNNNKDINTPLKILLKW